MEMILKSTTMNVAKINVEKQKLKEVTEELKKRHIKFSIIMVKKDREWNYTLRIFNCDSKILDLMEILITV